MDTLTQNTDKRKRAKHIRAMHTEQIKCTHKAQTRCARAHGHTHTKHRQKEACKAHTRNAHRADKVHTQGTDTVRTCTWTHSHKTPTKGSVQSTYAQCTQS